MLLGLLASCQLRGGGVLLALALGIGEGRMPLTESVANHEWADELLWFNPLLTNHLNHIHPPLFFISIYFLLVQFLF
jgi:hypothetical protein